MKTRKKKIPRLTLMMVIALLGLVVAQDTEKSRGSFYITNERSSMKDRIREARNFRPEILGTAAGFGKRRDPFESLITREDRHRPSISTTMQNFPKRILIYWILQHVRGHPEIVRESMSRELLLNGKKSGRLLPDDDQRLKSIGIIRFH